MNIQTIPIEQFSEFLQGLLNERLDCFLSSLLKLFGAFFINAKLIIELMVELTTQISTVPYFCRELIKPQQLIHNALHCLNQFFTEHPQFLSIEYCDHFMQVATERITQIKGNTHPVNHIQLEGRHTRTICRLMAAITTKIALLSTQANSIIIEIGNHHTILTQKDEIYKKFNGRVQYLIKQYQLLTEDQIFLKHYHLYLVLQQQTGTSLVELVEQLKHGMGLAEELFDLLEQPIMWAKQVRGQSKRNMKGSVQEVQLLAKYIPILSSRESMWSTVQRHNYDEIIEAIRILQRQPSIDQKEELYAHAFKSSEFRSIVNKKEQFMLNMNAIFKKGELQNEWNDRQPLENITLVQLQQLLPQIFSNLSQYIKLCKFYKHTQQEILDFFQSKFQIQVILDCDDLESIK